MKNKFKQLMALVLALAMCVTCNTVVFAADVDDDVIVTETAEIPEGAKLVEFDVNGNDEVNLSLTDDGDIAVTTSTLSGYGQKTFSGSGTSFTINVSGTSSAGCGMTIKATSPDSSAWGYVSVKKPSGDYYKNSVYVSCSEEKFVQLYFVKGGTWTIVPSAWYNPASSVTIQVWIYA